MLNGDTKMTKETFTENEKIWLDKNIPIPQTPTVSPGALFKKVLRLKNKEGQ